MREVPVHGQAAAVSGGDRHAVVQRDAGAAYQRSQLVGERVEERDRLDQVRREPFQEQPALLQRFPYEAKSSISR